MAPSMSHCKSNLVQITFNGKILVGSGVNTEKVTRITKLALSSCNLLTFCIETVHHALHNVQLVLNGEVDEVGVNQNVVGWSQLCVILEEQGRGNLRTVGDKWSDVMRCIQL